MPIISVRDLVVEYDGRPVLDGLNLDIEPGEIIVLLGVAVQERVRSCATFLVLSSRSRLAPHLQYYVQTVEFVEGFAGRGGVCWPRRGFQVGKEAACW